MDESASHIPLPVYFSNVCLRFLPVLDVVVHRFIELTITNVHQILGYILDHLSILYKFHGAYSLALKPLKYSIFRPQIDPLRISSTLCIITSESCAIIRC